VKEQFAKKSRPNTRIVERNVVQRDVLDRSRHYRNLNHPTYEED
jgi:hypothetical protein